MNRILVNTWCVVLTVLWASTTVYALNTEDFKTFKWHLLLLSDLTNSKNVQFKVHIIITYFHNNRQTTYYFGS